MIRPAAPADVAAICRLIHALAEYEKLAEHCFADEDRLRRHLFGPRPYAEALVAEEGAAVFGYALFFPIYSTFRCEPALYLEDLFVLPGWRGHGHGKALLAAVARAAVERGFPRLDWAVLDWNEPAIRFYRSLGAEPLDTWTIYRLSGAALTALARAA